MMNRRQVLGSALAAGLAAAPRGRARAAEPVAIGAVYPLTGTSAQAGNAARLALGTAVDIINGGHAPIPVLMGKGGGLDRLGGAPINLIFADHQGDPQKAQAEAERLITQNNVAAIIGSYQSATAATIGQICERYEIPYLSAENSSPSLTQRGLRWFFRTTPNDVMFTQGMFSFFKDQGAKSGRPVRTVALIHEDSIFGTDSANVQRKLAEAAGIKVVDDIRYRANSPSLAAEAERLKAADADVIMPTSYTSDAILLVRSMHDIGYAPRAIMAQAAGFQEHDFIIAAGPLAEGVFSRSSFALDAAKARPGIEPVNRMFHDRAGIDLNDNTSREVTGLLVLADAINRAGATKNEAIRAALVATDIPGAQTIMPWAGVKFDETGQNTLANPVIQQIRDGAYHTVWPFDLAVMEAEWKVGQ